MHESYAIVIPAKAGIQRLWVEQPQATLQRHWVPACAGTTEECMHLPHSSRKHVLGEYSSRVTRAVD